MNDWHSIRFLLIGAVATIVVASSFASWFAHPANAFDPTLQRWSSIAGDGAKGGIGGYGGVAGYGGSGGKGPHSRSGGDGGNADGGKGWKWWTWWRRNNLVYSNSSEHIPRRFLVMDSPIE